MKAMTTEILTWRRTRAIAVLTVREAMRQRLVAAFLLLALALVAGVHALRDLNFGGSLSAFVADCGFGVMAVIGSALAISLTAQLVLVEVESRTVDTLFAKPVTRAEFVVGKFLGLAGLLAAFCAFITVLLTLLVAVPPAAPIEWASGDRPAVALRELAVGGYLQWLKLIILAALVLLVASYARTQLFVVVAGIVLLLAGHLQSVAHDAYARSASMLVKAIGFVTTGWLPNFNLFAAPPGGSTGADPMSLGFLSLYAGGYVLVACGLTAICFWHREL